LDSSQRLLLTESLLLEHWFFRVQFFCFAITWSTSSLVMAPSGPVPFTDSSLMWFFGNSSGERWYFYFSYFSRALHVLLIVFLRLVAMGQLSFSFFV
jgi:hypothetical protein